MQFNDLYLISESRFYNRTLHTKFWKDKKFNSGIREKLVKIAYNVARNSDVVSIDDIQLTGSLANYNYTKYSDLDVHILTDFESINSDTSLVKAALDGKRFIWNLRHEIKMHGHEVEIYFQDTNEPHIASGLYSLLNKDWITVPKYDPPEVDPKDVDRKASTIVHDIDKVIQGIEDADTPEDAEDYYKKASSLKSKIGNMRRSGLKREGEFSVENLAFKELRNGGAIGRLINAISKSYGKIYSENMLQYPDGAGKKIYGLPDSVKDLLGVGKKEKGPRHHKWGTGLQRPRQNFVPDMHKPDPTSNHKIEVLRKTPGIMIATPSDIEWAQQEYKIKELSTDNTREDPKFLGTTEIMLYYNPNKGAYCFEKV